MIKLLRESVNAEDVFKTFIYKLSNFKINTMEIKKKKKLIGDFWEAFCLEYLKYKGFKNVKFIYDADGDTLAKYSLIQRDVGIDIICEDRNDNPIAVQCKFRSRGGVSWKELSTFEALCARTGPWHKHIIMTNTYVSKREGAKNEKDWSITSSSFNKLKRHEWNSIAGYGNGNMCGDADIATIKENWLNRIEKEISKESQQKNRK